jgi:hypothetical protein
MGLLSEVLMYCLAFLLGDEVGGYMSTIMNWVNRLSTKFIHFENAWNLSSTSSFSVLVIGRGSWPGQV